MFMLRIQGNIVKQGELPTLLWKCVTVQVLVNSNNKSFEKCTILPAKASYLEATSCHEPQNREIMALWMMDNCT
jgi:hypothetical protein